METNKPKARLVAIGRHMLSCLSANDYIEIGERRWHALHNRAQEMLEDSRADSAQRVECMKAIYDLRDRTTQLAIQHGATLEGALEVIEHGQEVVFEKEHGDQHHMGRSNGRLHSGQGSRVCGVFGCGMHVQVQARVLTGQPRSGHRSGRTEMGIHGDDHQTHLISHSGPLPRRGCLW